MPRVDAGDQLLERPRRPARGGGSSCGRAACGSSRLRASSPGEPDLARAEPADEHAPRGRSAAAPPARPRRRSRRCRARAASSGRTSRSCAPSRSAASRRSSGWRKLVPAYAASKPRTRSSSVGWPTDSCTWSATCSASITTSITPAGHSGAASSAAACSPTRGASPASRRPSDVLPAAPARSSPPNALG